MQRFLDGPSITHKYAHFATKKYVLEWDEISF